MLVTLIGMSRFGIFVRCNWSSLGLSHLGMLWLRQARQLKVSITVRNVAVSHLGMLLIEHAVQTINIAGDNGDRKGWCRDYQSYQDQGGGRHGTFHCEDRGGQSRPAHITT